jgi:hypothetical protein
MKKVQCIGTVVVSLYFTKGTAANRFCKDAFLLLTSKDGLRQNFTQQVCGIAGGWYGTNFGLHNYYYTPYLSAQSTYLEGYAAIQFGQ